MLLLFLMFFAQHLRFADESCSFDKYYNEMCSYWLTEHRALLRHLVVISS